MDLQYFLICTATCKNYLISYFLLYISYTTKFVQNIFTMSILVQFWWNLYVQKRECMKFSVIILKYLFEAHILNIYDLKTNLNYLSSKVLSSYCFVFFYIQKTFHRPFAHFRLDSRIKAFTGFYYKKM